MIFGKLASVATLSVQFHAGTEIEKTILYSL